MADPAAPSDSPAVRPDVVPVWDFPEEDDALSLLDSAIEFMEALMGADMSYATLPITDARTMVRDLIEPEAWDATIEEFRSRREAATQPEPAIPPPLDVEIEQMALDWPSWTFLFGHEVYSPIPGSPGEVNHRELVGRMIWWATARTDDDLGHLVVKSAERQPSLASAIRHLKAQLPAAYRQQPDTGEPR